MPEREKTASTIMAAAVCLFMAMAALSCTTLGLSKDEKGREVLTASIEAFNHSLRWEDYSAAAIWVPSGRKEMFWKEVDNFKGKIRIVDFKIRELDFIEDSGLATAFVHFQYYYTTSSILESVTIPQKWYFSEKDKGWQLGLGNFQMITRQASGL